MIVSLNNGLYLCTDAGEAALRFKDGQFRAASTDECAIALHLASPIYLKDRPFEFGILVLAIADQSAVVGILLAH